jgi:hypothetical protein
MRRWLIAGGVVVVLGLGGVALAVQDEPEPTFCTLGLPIAPTPPNMAPGVLQFQDREPAGPDRCDEPVDGSHDAPVLRGDDCAIVYPDAWTADRSVTSLDPTNADGTCWLS